jgi:mono/diheme cytochrome c family protein
MNKTMIRVFACVTWAAVASMPTRALAADPSGAELYAQNCATCHGVYGEGDGPMAPMLSIPMQDLRYLSARNGGTFPREVVINLIDGRDRRAAHGGEMPVWGIEFLQQEGYSEVMEAFVAQKIAALADYLGSIQVAVAVPGESAHKP